MTTRTHLMILQLTLPANAQQHRDADKLNELGSQPLRKEDIPHHKYVLEWKFASKEQSHPSSLGPSAIPGPSYW